MATIKDVAQAAQVSTAAVSRVLNKDDNISVSPEVRGPDFSGGPRLGLCISSPEKGGRA